MRELYDLEACGGTCRSGRMLWNTVFGGLVMDTYHMGLEYGVFDFDLGSYTGGILKRDVRATSH